MFKLTRLPAVQRLVSYYDQLSGRDQKALQVLAVAVAAFVLYFGIWRPIDQFQQDQAANLQQARSLMSWIQTHEQEARALARSRTGQTGTPVGDSRSLMTTVTTSAKQAGLPLARFEPSGEQGMRIWLEDAPFNRVAGWLQQLESRYGIRVDQASIQRAQNPGMITARFKLEL